jgi:hypothetical protein
METSFGAFENLSLEAFNKTLIDINIIIRIWDHTN